jgi:hypothetical protein
MELVTTKKMVAALNYDAETKSGEFVVPRLDGTDEPTFIGIDTRRSAKYGAVSYTGRDLNAQVLLDRFISGGAEVDSEDRVRQLFNHYMAAVKELRVGSVVSISYNESFVLNVEASRPSQFQPTT